MRVKRGTTKHRRHKKILELTKGYRMSYGRLFKRSNEAVLHAGEYSQNDRRQRRGQMKGKWLKVIAAGLYGHGISYSTFMGSLKKANLSLNTKMLAEMVLDHPEDFSTLVTKFAK